MSEKTLALLDHAFNDVAQDVEETRVLAHQHLMASAARWKTMDLIWTSPNEALPSQGQRVLVACGPQPRTLFAWFYDNTWINDSNFRVHGVFAWADVPDPPSELAEQWADFLPDRHFGPAGPK